MTNLVNNYIQSDILSSQLNDVNSSQSVSGDNPKDELNDMYHFLRWFIETYCGSRFILKADDISFAKGKLSELGENLQSILDELKNQSPPNQAAIDFIEDGLEQLSTLQKMLDKNPKVMPEDELNQFETIAAQLWTDVANAGAKLD